MIDVHCYIAKFPHRSWWTYEDYEAAFQHATGRRTDDFDSDEERDRAIEESEAELTCFGWSA